LMQTLRSVLPSIAEKRNTKSKKHSCKNNACRQWGVTWQTDAIGFQKCDLCLALIFFHWNSYNNKSGNFPIAHCILRNFCIWSCTFLLLQKTPWWLCFVEWRRLVVLKD
jgi:hypothetical protein